jgi:hypothetical protein
LAHQKDPHAVSTSAFVDRRQVADVCLPGASRNSFGFISARWEYFGYTKTLLDDSDDSTGLLKLIAGICKVGGVFIISIAVGYGIH